MSEKSGFARLMCDYMPFWNIFNWRQWAQAAAEVRQLSFSCQFKAIVTPTLFGSD